MNPSQPVARAHGVGGADQGSALRRFVDSGASYWAAMLAAGVLNLGFNVFASRRLGPVDYGALAAIIALINIFLFAVDAFRRTVTAVVAELNRLATALWILRRGTIWMLGLGVIAMLAVGVFVHPIGAALHLRRPVWVWLAAVALIPAYTGAVSTGVLQGMRLFRESGGVNLSAAIVKFASLVILLELGAGITGGTVATLVEVTVIWIGGMVVLFGWVLRSSRPEAPAAGPDYRALLGLPVALTVARLLYFNVDILLARHFLGSYQAGLFAALAITGRIIAYGTGALPPVIYPYLIRDRADPRLTARYMLLIVAATLLSGGAVMGLFALAPGAVVHLFGSHFSAIKPYVAWYGLGFLFYSLAYVLLHYLLAVESWWVWVYALGGGAVEIAGMVIWHGDIAQFTRVVVIFFAGLFVVTALHVVADVARRRGGPTGARRTAEA